MLLALAVLAALAQEPARDKPVPPPAPPLPGGATGGTTDPAILALVPGAIPPDATPAAREAWKKIEAATFVPGASREPITAFDLGLDVRYKRSASGTNELKATYRYLAPGWVRIDLENSSTMRGPMGDWLEDRKRGGKPVDLRVAREHAEDRRQLDETASVAKHFVALSNPGALRIASIEKLDAAPARLPKPSMKRAGELAWIRIRSPDFRLVGAGATAAMSRATIGFAPDTGRVEIALVEEDRPTPALAPSARVVELAGTLEAQGYRVPKQIRVYSIAEGRGEHAFTDEPGMDLYVVNANLRPTLAPENFQPVH